MTRKMFFLCFTLMEASSSSPCNIAHKAKALFFHLDFDPPNIKLCLPRSLKLLVFISHPTGFFGEMVNNPVLGKRPAFLYCQAGVGNTEVLCLSSEIQVSTL